MKNKNDYYADLYYDCREELKMIEEQIKDTIAENNRLKKQLEEANQTINELKNGKTN